MTPDQETDKSIGQLVLEEIIKQGMVSVSYPDPNEAHVFVWNGNAAEQLDALIAENTSQSSAQ